MISTQAFTWRNKFLLLIYSQIIWVSPSYGYIDPGIGSLIFQGFLVTLISVSVFWRGIKNKVTNFFMRDDNSNRPTDNPEDQDETE
jgi:hypothetical protein